MNRDNLFSRREVLKTTVAAIAIVGLQVIQSQAQTLSQKALLVYGQDDFTANSPNRGGPVDASGLHFPLGIAVNSDGSVYIADRNNHRVLQFAPGGNTKAVRVYGQHGNFNTYIANFDGKAGSGGGPSADSLSMPTVVALDGTGSVYIDDRENHRVLFYPSGQTTATKVFGQFGSFNTNPVNNDGTGASGGPSSENIGVYSLGVVADSQGGLYVADSSNNRILHFAVGSDTKAARVYGQHGRFTTNSKNNNGKGTTERPSRDSLNFPRGMALDSKGGLYVADRENNRVLYFAPGNTRADRVYGQYGSFTTSVPNNNGKGQNGAPSADSLFSPRAVAVDAQDGLFIADTGNNRVLHFSAGSTKADRVYGQFGSFAAGIKNNDSKGAEGKPSAEGLYAPQGIAVGPDGRVYINDTNNNRMVVFAKPN
jgi:sugar lactone lactonase YvrE